MPDSAALWFYLATFGALLAAGLGLPIPEEIPIVMAGAAVGHVADAPPVPSEWVAGIGGAALSGTPLAPFPGNLPWPALVSNQVEVPSSSPVPNSLRWWIMLPVCIIGAVTGDVFLYAIGRLGGPRLLNSRWMKHLFPPEKRQRTEDNFHKYGALVLVFARFLPTIRSPIFIMAGIMRVPFHRFLLADGLAGCCGVSLLFTLAFWFGNQFQLLVERAEGTLGKLKPLLILLALTAVATYLVIHFFRKPVATGDPGGMLLIGDKVVAKMTNLHILPAAEPSTDQPASAQNGQVKASPSVQPDETRPAS